MTYVQKILAIVLVSCLLFVGGGVTGYVYRGRNAERDLATARSSFDHELGLARSELTGIVERSRSIYEGLGRGVEIAQRITDRNKRIESLIRSIIEAVHRLREISEGLSEGG